MEGGKSMRRLTFFGFICVLAMFCFAATDSRQALAKQIVLKLGHINPPGGAIDKQSQKFKQLVEAKTDGQVRIDVYPASQLGKIREILEGISMGTVDMTVEGVGMLAHFDKDLNFFNAPFMYMNIEAFMVDPYLMEVLERIRKKTGIKMLSHNGVRPPFHLFTKTKPVQSLEELKGVKLRMPPVKAFVDVWNGLGAIAVAIPWSEVYMALSQNVVDGMAHNFLQIRDMKFYEQLNYATLLAFKPVVNAVWITDSKYKSFSPEIQKSLKEAAIESGEYFTELAVTENKKAREQLESAGIKVFTINKEPWFEKARAVHRKLEEGGAWSKGMLDKVNPD